MNLNIFACRMRSLDAFRLRVCFIKLYKITLPLKIFVLTPRFPYPLEKGDKLRIYYQLQELAKRHEIVLCALHEEPILAEHRAKVEALCSKVYTFKLPKWRIYTRLLTSFLGGLPLQVAYFYHRHLTSKIQACIKETAPDHIFCQLIRVAPYVADLDIPKTIDYMDTLSVNAARWADRASWPLKPILKREAKQLAHFEARMFTKFDTHTIISEQDRALLQFEKKTEVHILPNGINLDFFKPLERPKKYDISFIGNMGYKPNVEAALYLVKKIMPEVWAKYPNTSVLLAGARPTKEIQALAETHPQVHVTGWIDDIREAYASSRFFVAPLFIGSGQQNKILEAMAMGIPCITTPLVNNAIGACPKKDILLAETRKQFVQNIFLLIQHIDKGVQLQQNGLKFIQTNYHWSTFVHQLENIFKSNEKTTQ